MRDDVADTGRIDHDPRQWALALGRRYVAGPGGRIGLPMSYRVADRHGEYGLDGRYGVLGLLAQLALQAAAGATTVKAIRHRHPLLAVPTAIGGAALGAATASYLYSTRRGKFEVWTELLDQLDLRGHERVLDIGCGRGAVLLLAADRVPHGRAIGVDVWRRRDQVGNSRAATEHNAILEGVADRVELVHADARDLPFASESFDVIVSNLTVHNIAGAEGRHQALREAVRVLRPGGRLRIVDFLGGRYVEPLRAAGCGDVTVCKLDGRMRFGSPVNAIVLVSARKPAQRAGSAGEGEDDERG
ncbi:MAG: class I SAM-dependent methyltransferase [Streptosporangiaceae bacterium]